MPACAGRRKALRRVDHAPFITYLARMIRPIVQLPDAVLRRKSEPVKKIDDEIKKLIEDEDSKKPLTDDQIVGILNKDGVKLSRRTVAKYRDQMQIPGSRERTTML